MTRRFALLTALPLLPLALPALAGEGEEKSALFSADRYINHVRYLSSDELQGRRPGTDGIEKAAAYIVEQFKAAGLQPAGPGGSWYQQFEVRQGKKYREDEAALYSFSIEGSGAKIGETWMSGVDWTPLPFSAPGSIEAPVAFAGFGIEADEYLWNDYCDFDPAGKVLIVLRHEPRGDNPKAEFGGDTASSYAMFIKKANIAADKGARGLILVDPPGRDGYDPDKLYAWSDTETRNSYRIPLVHVTAETADELLKAGGMPPVAELREKLERDRKPLSRDLKGVCVSMQTGLKYVEARNVIALLEGSERPDEYVVIGGHFDHLGNVSPGFGSNNRAAQIHNGADDNASGTAGVIELARVLAAGPRPRRSILFMTFSAEEMGLLGSAHYVDQPTVELTKIKAMLNLDMIGRFSQDDFTVYGVTTATEFPDIVEAAAKNAGIGKYAAPKRTDGIFGASDHASFFRKGIPVLFAFTGLHKQYHKPEDDWERIDAQGATQVLAMFHELAGKVSNMVEGPIPSKPEKEKPESTDGNIVGADGKIGAVDVASANPADKSAVVVKPADSDAAAKEAAKAAAAAAHAAPKDGETEAPRMPAVRLGIAPSYSDSGPGILVDTVAAEGLAKKAGMLDGDRILRLNKTDVTDIYGYMEAMRTVKPGEELTILIERKKEKQTLKVMVEAPKKASNPG